MGIWDRNTSTPIQDKSETVLSVPDNKIENKTDINSDNDKKVNNNVDFEHSEDKDYSMFEMKEKNFGKFLPYVLDDEITDIDFNGKRTWLTKINNERILVDEEIDPAFIKRFTQRIANHDGVEFNKKNPCLEAETESLRISILNESVAKTGTSICIRKTPPFARITPVYAVETRYCNEKILHLLANCVKAHMNFIFCGEPRAGKTECAKFFSTYIPDRDRVFTIEDVMEWHYDKLKPNADCVQVEVDEEFDYSDAIKASLKQNPRWLMITEVRGNEVKDLIKGFTTGVSGMTTLHTDDVTKAPQRMVNMIDEKINTERFLDNIYEFVDVGILINIKIDENGKQYRTIDQVGFYIKDNTNYCRVYYSEGRYVTNTLPDAVLKKMSEAKIENPFFNPEVDMAMQSIKRKGDSEVE